MSNLPRKTGASSFGLISGCVGLALCIGQSYKGHVDAKHERDRMQEMHEQKMHYLHEFHRQQLHAREHKIAALEAEKRADEAERLAGMYSQKAGEEERKGEEAKRQDSKVVAAGAGEKRGEIGVEAGTAQ